MKNITLAIEDELLEQARALAQRRHTSLNAIVRSLLSEEVEQEDRIAKARAGLKQLMDNATLDMGPDYKWNRQEIYDEREDRMLSRHQRPDLRGAGKDKG
ncbi:MAG: hypothetical protein HY834_08475 [Devosia nanyangense]|uniref:Uncharacterized protein n=1 Tax=Devosia nanyangense TaxID=1228055 RepID=A0A933NY75_9HYPH|nr:hypothetical protein [Devosia nanyangense]